MKFIKNKLNQKIVIYITIFFLTIYSSLNIPTWSNNLIKTNQQAKVQENEIIEGNNNALELVKQGNRFYDQGKFAEAIEEWDKAADIYTQEGNEFGRVESLTNKSQALQNLGNYKEACNTSLEALNYFELKKFDCGKIVDENSGLKEQLEEKINSLKDNPESLSINQSIALRLLGDNLRRLGYLEDSKNILELGLKVAEYRQDNEEISGVQIDLGNILRALGNREREIDPESPPELAYNIGIDSLKSNESPVERALSIYKDYELALNYYKNAAAISNEKNTIIRAQINRISLLLDMKQWWKKAIDEAASFEGAKKNPQILSYGLELDNNLNQKSQKLRSEIYPQINNLPLSWTTLNTKINLADILLKQTTNDSIWLKDLELLLEQIREDAEQLGDKRIEAITIGYQGKLSQQQALNTQNSDKRKQYLAEAQELTNKALQVLDQVPDEREKRNNRDIRYRLLSQLGRIYQQQNNIPAAIGAYEGALQNLEELRKDLPSINKNVQFDFKEEIEPIYREYVELLLSSKQPISDENLKTARDVIESLQLAELDNHLKDPCSVIKISNIDKFIDENPKAQTSAVIYPVIIPVPKTEQLRLDIIVKFPKQKLRHYPTPPLPKKDFDKTLDNLSQLLYEEPEKIIQGLKRRITPEDISSESEERSAESREDKLIEELIEALEPNKKKLLPLLEQVYNWLVKPIKADLTNVDTLVFVLDGRLQSIPISALYALYDGEKYLLEDYSIALIPSLQLIDPKPLSRNNLNILAAGLSIPTKDFPNPLTNVEKELENIGKLPTNSTILLNSDFTEENIGDLLDEEKFPIVHLATHGKFSSNSERTFIVTGDEKRIRAKDFDNLLKISQSKKIGLLVLSSCETAQGDPRAVLGLAGIAVRSGASTTIATLWSVEDSSAAILMSKFYEELIDSDSNPDINKSLALKNAQLELLRSKYNHPFFWAAYVLVGSWF